jgi:hypothetical protein
VNANTVMTCVVVCSCAVCQKVEGDLMSLRYLGTPASCVDVGGEGVSTRENESKSGRANHKIKKSRLITSALRITKCE